MTRLGRDVVTKRANHRRGAKMGDHESKVEVKKGQNAEGKEPMECPRAKVMMRRGRKLPMPEKRLTSKYGSSKRWRLGDFMSKGVCQA